MEDHEVRERVARAALLEAAADAPIDAPTRKLALRLANAQAVKVDDDFQADPHSVAAVFASALALADAAGPKPPPEPEKPRAKARRTPAIPPDPHGGRPFDDFVTPEEYVSTPERERLSEPFQRRVERSRHLWPDAIPASVFPSEGRGPWD